MRSSRKIICFVVFITLCVQGKSQVKTFIKAFKKHLVQQFFDATATYDNGTLAVGQQEIHSTFVSGSSDGCDMLIMKLDSCGELVWYKSIGYSDKHSDGARSVIEMKSKAIVVGGFYMHNLVETGAVLLMDQLGNVQWSQAFPGIRFITDVTETQSGNIIMTGYTHSEKVVYLKMSATGNVIWKKEISHTSSSSRGYAIQAVNNGNYLLLWNSVSPASDAMISSIDPATGSILWSKRYGQGSTMPLLREWEPSMVIDPNDNNVVIANATTSLGGATETEPDILSFKIDLLGNVLWAQTYGDAADDQPKDIAYDQRTGGFVISGKTTADVSGTPTIEPMLGENALVLQLTNSGGVIRSNVYGGNGGDKATNTISYREHYVTTMVCFNSLGSDSYDPFVVKTDTFGIVACQHATYSFSAQSASLQENSLTVSSIDYAVNLVSELPYAGSVQFDIEVHCQSCEPFYKFVSDPVICIDDTVQFVKQDGCLSAFTLNGNIVTDDTLYFSFDTPGIKIFTMDHECVESPFEYEVKVDQPIAKFDWENECLYDPLAFFDQSTSTYGHINQWNWDFGDNLGVSPDPNPTYQYAADGNYDVTLMIETGEGCKDTITNQVTAYPIPEASLTAYPECLYDPIQFIDLTTINSPGVIDQMIIDFGDGSPTDQQGNIEHYYPHSGIFNVNYLTISNEGCVDDTTISIEVYHVPNAIFTANTVCENEPPTIFRDQSTIDSGSNIVAWYWNFDDNNNNVSMDHNPTHIYQTGGDYNVQLVVESNNACFDTLVQEVTVLRKPTNLFTSNYPEGCDPHCVNFYNYTQSNATSITNWDWWFGDETLAGSENPAHCFRNFSNRYDTAFDVRLISTNDLGCKDTLLVERYVKVWHNPKADFDIDSSWSEMFNPQVDFINESIGEDFYDWDFGDGNSSTLGNPRNVYLDTGTYQIRLIVETVNACVDTAYGRVRIDPVTNIYIPNTFTPNGDGDNDGFIFKGFNLIEDDLDFRVYDRWGLKLYQTDKFIPWDGTYKGEVVPTDTYVYYLECYDFFRVKHKRVGHVNVIK